MWECGEHRGVPHAQSGWGDALGDGLQESPFLGLSPKIDAGNPNRVQEEGTARC